VLCLQVQQPKTTTLFQLYFPLCNIP